MKRIRSACLEQTVHFQCKEGVPVEAARQQVKEEYAAYQAQLQRHRTQYRIIAECEQPDGSLIVQIKKQNHMQPVGSYLD